ncbi:MAG: NAD(P)-binding domain-containing protein [Nocardioidaceae bacterium]
MAQRKIAVLGTGNVGQTLSRRLAGLGYDVMVGARSRDSESLAPFAAIEGVHTGSFADAAAFGDLVINATNGQRSLDALDLAGADNLAGKPLLDVSNDLEPVEGGFPKPVATSDNSLGQRIQSAFPDAHVVKSLNTMTNSVMVEPASVPGDHVVFLSGDRAEAKEAIVALLSDFGWRPEQVFDLGGIDTAPAVEMVMALWLRVLAARGMNPRFNWAIHSGA